MLAAVQHSILASMNLQIERSKAPVPGPALDMFAEEDQKTTDSSKDDASEPAQDSVGKISSTVSVVTWLHVK